MNPAHENPFDRTVERLTRALAQRTSRRSVFAFLGKVMVGGMVLPLLPVDRTLRMRQAHAEAFVKGAQVDDQTQCNYWKYCGIDGYLCSCCGSPGNNVCPAGSQPSPSGWVGSCVNPTDKLTYLVAYRDCCGKDSCGRCPCLNTEGEYPVYRPQLNNDMVWCFGADTMLYHCSGSAVIGKAG